MANPTKQPGQEFFRVAKMLKFIRGRGQQPTTERQRQQRELLNFKKTVQHGFPSKPTALAYDPILSLLAIGTASGAIKLFGKPGVEFYGQNEVSEGCGINKIIFLNGEGRLITILNDNSLVLWEIEESKCAKLVKVRALALEGKLKRISASRLETGNQHLLLGTEGGNVYLLNTRSFQMEENIIYQDVVIQNVPEDYKIRPGAVEALEEMPNNPKKLLIGYNRGLMVLWDRDAQRTEQTYISTQELQGFSWHPSGSKFKSAHNDGSLVTWDASVGGRTPLEEPTTIYGPFPCKPITKIIWHDNKSDELVIFGGGMPRASHSDRYTVTAMKGMDEKHVVFDFTSHIVDFVTIMPDKNASGGQALIVLAEEEIVVIDLSDPEWRMISLPYLVSLHASAVTCLQMVSPVPHSLWKYLKEAGRQSETSYSNSAFPITGGNYLNEKPDGEEEKETVHELLLTGHEDGSVRFWDVDGVALAPLFKFSSEPYFSTSDDFDDDIADDAGDEEDWPPFRKVGCFDPYSDDPRLAVKKVALCPFTSTLIVAGTAGHILIVKLKNQDDPPKKIIGTVMNIVRDRDGFVWKGHDQLKLAESKGKMKKQSSQKGATVEALVQLHPPASITAITLHSTWGVLAAGTAHGLAIYDTVRHVSIQTKCTLNPNDLSGAGDTPISRRKSFKKSLRESFRRLRKGRSQRNANPNKPGSPASSPGDKAESSQPGSAAGTSVALSRPVERQVEARPVEDAFGSMVRCLALEDTFLVNQQLTSPTLWAGTNSGNVLIFTVTIPKGNKRKDEDVSCLLGKEIQLKHRAPVVNIVLLDGIGSPLPIPGEVDAGLVPAPDNVGPHRVVICSEEQFKTFTLPTLKPFCKSKLTATEGSMLRRAAPVRLTPSNVRAEEAQYALFGITNMGEILALTLPDLRRLLNVPCIKREDINGITTLAFSRCGEAIFPISSSELQRVSIATQKVTETKCQLNNMTRVKPETLTNGTNGDTVSESGTSEAGSKKDEAAANTSLNASSGAEEQLEVSMGELTLDSVKDHLSPSTPGVATSTPKSSPNANATTANSSSPSDRKDAAMKNGGNSQSTEQKVLDSQPDVVDQENTREMPTPEPPSEINGSADTADGKAPLAISEDL